MNDYLPSPPRLGAAARALALASSFLVSAPALANGRVPAFDARIGATPMGRTDAAKPITLALHLPSRDPAGLSDFIAHVTQPGDKLFRHYLTPAQFSARFGASQTDYDTIVSWAKSKRPGCR